MYSYELLDWLVFIFHLIFFLFKVLSECFATNGSHWNLRKQLPVSKMVVNTGVRNAENDRNGEALSENQSISEDIRYAYGEPVLKYCITKLVHILSTASPPALTHTAIVAMPVCARLFTHPLVKPTWP